MNESRATRYQRLKRRTHVAGLAAGGVLLATLAATPLGTALSGWATATVRGPGGVLESAMALLLFVTCAVGLSEIVALPSVLYLALVVDRRYGQADASVEGVIAAQAQAALVVLPLAFAAAAVLEIAVGIAGPLWWALAGLGLAGLVAAAHHGAPTLLAAWGGSRRMDRVPLGPRLLALAEAAHVPIAGIDEWRRDDRTTAMIAGVGNAKRIFVSTEMLRDWSDEEIEVVVAHELAHHAYRDLWRALALDAAVLAASFAVADLVVAWIHPGGVRPALQNPSGLPLIALVAGSAWIAATPLRHAQSRGHERRADRFALGLTGADAAFAAAVRRLGARHLAEEQPSRLTRWLYHRHPTVAERLALAGADDHPAGRPSR